MNPTVPTPLTRVTLSNGYRAYRQQGNEKPAQPKRVRFVKGHVTIPDDIITASAQQPRAAAAAAAGEGTPLGEGRERTEVEEKGEGEGRLKALGAGQRPAARAACLDPDCKVESNAGRFVERGGIAVWRKEPRWRGSGTLRVLDDPVRDGERLAREGMGLARGRWRDRGWAGEDSGFDVWDRVEQGRGVGVLRWAEGEREAGFTLGDVDRREEPLMAVVVPMRQGKGADVVKRAGVAEEQVRQPEEEKEDAVAASVALTEAESESESDDGYDFLADLSLEEAEGWVPVMVAEEDEGDDWMSLTGSWIMMGPQASQKGDVALG